MTDNLLSNRTLQVRRFIFITDFKNIFFEFNNNPKKIFEKFPITGVGPISPKKTTQFHDFQLNNQIVNIDECADIAKCAIIAFFEIYISNYVVDVMNDVILKIEFPKFSSNFSRNAFDKVLNSTNYGDTIHLNLLKTLIK